MRHLSWMVVVCLLLSGCGGLTSMMDKLGEPKTDEEGEKIAPAVLVDFMQEVQLSKRWSTHAVGKYRSVNGGIRPAAMNGTIYVADSNGQVAAVDTASGQEQWKVELDVTIGGGVGVGGNLVLIGSAEGDVFALDAATGEQRWHTYVTSEVLAAPGTNGNVVVVQSQDGRVVGLDADNGEKLWLFEADVPVLTLRGTSSPIVGYDKVIVTFANGKVHALSPQNGSELWENRVAIPQGRTELERMVDIDGQPARAGDVLYVASYQGRVGALARSTGRGIWYQDASTTHDLAYSLEQVYLVQKNDAVKALRASSGQQLWLNEQLTYRKLSSPVVLSGYLVVADAEGYVHVLSLTDGRFMARTKVGAGVTAPMLVDGNVLYVLDNGGGLTAFSIE
ncbi:MAG: outer membrane protein assembly factor BamB [Gammaproteobacteria bacterium]|nr:MAG: outer membrane protein assembly factor BamB [Gammaproteobacteria bacterium]